jgi:23S rRNA (guanosine2251-2'-O)-methyltransferase
LWVYGLNPVIEVLRHRPKRVAEIRIHRGKGTPAEIFETAKKFNIPIKETSRADLENICGSEAHQGIIAKAPLPEYAQLGNLLERIKDKNSKGYGGPEGSRAHALILILDSISDPQNLGSLIRVAECAGVDAVIIPRDRAAGLSPAVAKASAGAIEWVRSAAWSILSGP